MATHDKFSRKRERYFINFYLRESHGESILVTQNYFFTRRSHSHTTSNNSISLSVSSYTLKMEKA